MGDCLPPPYSSARQCLEGVWGDRVGWAGALAPELMPAATLTMVAGNGDGLGLTGALRNQSLELLRALHLLQLSQKLSQKSIGGGKTGRIAFIGCISGRAWRRTQASARSHATNSPSRTGGSQTASEATFGRSRIRRPWCIRQWQPDPPSLL